VHRIKQKVQGYRESAELGENGVGGFGPDEGFGVVIVGFDPT
jgi:hypothetical protein